jgi:endonuclease/exonuclease/phosphatase family metal-dependent hydrolase
MKRFLSLLALCTLFTCALHAQDTLRVMTYNLLRYGAASPGGCTLTSVSVKNTFFSTIFNSARPDILGVNEMGPSTLYASNILVNVLDPIDPDYERTTYTNVAGSDIVNHLFYNSAKLGIAKEGVINHSLRDINVYKLYYKDPALVAGSDTTFIYVIMVHLIADGAWTPTAIEQANLIMNYLNSLGEPGNYIVMGDMNAHASTDAGMEVFTAYSNPDCRLYDPINRPGTWNNNSSFADIHTQATRVSSSDCGSTGGLDDRFDHIMVSSSILNDSARVRYIPGSYWAYGQDGGHYNNNINGPPSNTSVSAAVANALNAGSDHLPVIMDIADGEPVSDLFIELRNQPFSSELDFKVKGLSSKGEPLHAELLDLAGNLLIHQQLNTSHGIADVQLNTSSLTNGVYLLRVQQGGRAVVTKVVKM